MRNWSKFIAIVLCALLSILMLIYLNTALTRPQNVKPRVSKWPEGLIVSTMDKRKGIIRGKQIRRDRLHLFDPSLNASVVIHGKQNRRDILHLFDPPLNASVKMILMDIFDTFDAAMKQHRIVYFIFAGTLFGSYRHHGIVPWDDDIDVMVNSTQKRKLHRVLSTLYPNYKFSKMPHYGYKLYSMHSSYITSGIDWKSPFIDINFFGENSTHIWDIFPQYKNIWVWPKETVFPLIKRPYGNKYLDAPRCTGDVLNATYDLSKCISRDYSHITERRQQPIKVECSKLMQRFPFVRRRYSKDGTRVYEDLVRDGQTIRTITLKESCRFKNIY